MSESIVWPRSLTTGTSDEIQSHSEINWWRAQKALSRGNRLFFNFNFNFNFSFYFNFQRSQSKQIHLHKRQWETCAKKYVSPLQLDNNSSWIVYIHSTRPYRRIHQRIPSTINLNIDNHLHRFIQVNNPFPQKCLPWYFSVKKEPNECSIDSVYFK